MNVLPFGFWKAVSGGGGFTLVYDSTGAGGTAQTIGNTNVFQYGGLTLFNDSTARAVGKLSATVSLAAGDISGKTYHFKIWSLSGSNLGSLLATSTGVTGNNAWSNTVIDDTISYTIPSGTSVAITLDGGVDASNYINMYFISVGSASAPFPADLAAFSNTGANTFDFSGYNMAMRLYTSP